MLNSKYLRLDWRTALKRSIREGFGEGLLAVGENEKVVVLSADLAHSTRVDKFADKWPDRFFEVGVAEQNMAGVGAGLALEGFIPFLSSLAVFSPGRNWEQIRVSVGLTNSNVKIISSHGGLASGILGPSHEALEDIALMRVLPNMIVLAPADATQCKMAIKAAYQHEGPVYIRATRADTPDFTKEVEFEIGKAQVLRKIEKSDKMVTLVACGIQVWDSLMVAEQLAKSGIQCEVINMASIKPIDSETLLTSAKKTGLVVTVEDHQVMGGMGSAVSEVISENGGIRVVKIGVNDEFGVSGDWLDVYKKFGLSRESIAKRIKSLW